MSTGHGDRQTVGADMRLPFSKMREERKKRKELMNQVLDEIRRRESRKAPLTAVEECDYAIAWYARNGWKSRRKYFALESVMVIAGAAVTLVSVIVPNPQVYTAILGFIVVIGTGLRQSFHWQENYIRFTTACQKLKAARRIYNEAYSRPGK